MNKPIEMIRTNLFGRGSLSTMNYTEISEIGAEITAERCRQIEAEGLTTEQDDEHKSGQMVLAAICYCWSSIAPAHKKGAPSYWPWGQSWWKPKNPRRDLVRAAALIMAEIGRLDRLPK